MSAKRRLTQQKSNRSPTIIDNHFLGIHLFLVFDTDAALYAC
jgi:hypothetical protein